MFLLSEYCIVMSTGNSSSSTLLVESSMKILDETLQLLHVYEQSSAKLMRLNELLSANFKDDAQGQDFRSLCCYGCVGTPVSLQTFNQLCILPRTHWSVELSQVGVSVAASHVHPDETTKYTSDLAATVADNVRTILRYVIDNHEEKALITSFIPRGRGIPFTWFKALIGSGLMSTPTIIPSNSTLRDRVSRCLDLSLKTKVSNPATPFFSETSGAYWQVVEDSFDIKKIYLESCSAFPKYLEGLLEENKTTLDRLAGLVPPAIRHYGVEAMVADAYLRASQKGMESADLLLPDGKLGGTVFALHNGMLSPEWLASYLVDTDSNFFMDDVRAKAMNAKERMLRIFSTHHSFENPSWIQFGVKSNVFLFLSQKASTAEEGWLQIANYVTNRLIRFINERLDTDSIGKQFKLEQVEFSVGVAALANPSLGLFALHSDARPGLVDSSITSYSKFRMIVPTLAIQNHCSPTCEISWVGKDDPKKTKLAQFKHDFVIAHWQLMNVNKEFEHQVRMFAYSSDPTYLSSPVPILSYVSFSPEGYNNSDWHTGFPTFFGLRTCQKGAVHFPSRIFPCISTPSFPSNCCKVVCIALSAR
jgi:hypothetical protein